MAFGRNSQIVFSLIKEFWEKVDTIEPRLVPAKRTVYSFYDLIILSELIDKFITPANSNIEKLFDLICDDYSTKDGIERFIDYRSVLQNEKEKYAWQNMSYMLKVYSQNQAQLP